MEFAQDAEAKLKSLAAEQTRLARMLELTERELIRRDEELAASEARFRDVIENNADAIVVVDRTGIVRFANRAATELFRGRQEKLIGSSFGFPLVAGETTELDILSGGSPRIAEMRVVQSEWQGRPASIASLRDVTERRQSEQNARALIREQTARNAAEAAAHRLRFLLESSTLLAASLDQATILSHLARLCAREIADWAIVFCTDDSGRLRRLEVSGRDPTCTELARDLESAAFEPNESHPVTRALKTRQPLLMPTVDEDLITSIAQDAQQLELIRQLRAESLMIVPMLAHERELGVLVLVSSDPGRRFAEQDLALAEDIAARAALAIENARLYGEVKGANETKADFLAVLSHDLRTPLTAIIGYSDLLDIGIPEPLPQKAHGHVQRIRTSARHLLYLLNELLAFARLDAGHEDLRLVDVDARTIARDVATVIEPLAHARGLEFVLDLGEVPLLLHTDPDKLRQILLNLLGNAVKYTERGEVRMEIRSRGQDAEFRVRDSGVGIAPEHLSRIFEPFWQVDSSQRSLGGGTGLGLSVVRRLATLLQGEVSVESTPGQGTTFTLWLPGLEHSHGPPRDVRGIPHVSNSDRDH
jgi:signal transduction histidine kinase